MWFEEIPFESPAILFQNVAHMDGAILLESAQLRKACGRYSYIGVDPFLWITCKNRLLCVDGEYLQANPFAYLREQLAIYALKNCEDLPPFQSGLAGFFGYELSQYLENISVPVKDELDIPDMAVGFYDLVIAFDHEEKRAWMIASGLPEQSMCARQQRAQLRMEWLRAMLSQGLHQFDAFKVSGVSSNFTAEQYINNVKQVIEHILCGDIFEANISQRFMGKCMGSAYSLYLQLRNVNPAPFAAYLKFDNVAIVSASPERFLKLTVGAVETRPIKGTRKRSLNGDEDALIAQELLTSAKDRAENVMIVDLMRNDLSRVCDDHSVQVQTLCGLESYATVHHLVSVVTGRLSSGNTAIDLLQATFPGGSITGAPKIKAMEIISQIEKVKRGPYCGSLGFIGFNGDMDTSIAIRTMIVAGNDISFHAGGAVVADSDPVAEYEETLAKAAALFKAINKEKIHDCVD